MNMAAGCAAAFSAITATALTRYGQTLGMSPFGFGILAALPFFTALAQIPASYAIERFGHRRLIAIFGIFGHRALWLLIAAVPWLVPHAWWWLGLLIFVGFSFTSAHFGTPASVSWAADLVPSRLRGRYYALRGQLVRVINVPLCLVLGWAMDHAQAHSLQTLQQVISLLLACAAVIGMMDGVLCLGLPDLWHQPRSTGLRFREILRQPLADPNFRCYLGYTAFMTFATGYVGPFIWLYLVDVVKESNTEAIFMTMVGTSLINLLGMRYWGRRVDRQGYRRVLLWAGVLIINGASTWALVTPTTKVWGYIFVLLSAFAWPGMELATGNLLYAMSETRRDGAHLGSAYAAISSAAVAIAGTLSGIFGGWLAEALKHWHTIIYGWPVTFHVVLFFISAVFRIVALLFVLGMKEERKVL